MKIPNKVSHLDLKFKFLRSILAERCVQKRFGFWKELTKFVHLRLFGTFQLIYKLHKSILNFEIERKWLSLVQHWILFDSYLPIWGWFLRKYYADDNKHFWIQDKLMIKVRLRVSVLFSFIRPLWKKYKYIHHK